MNLAKVNEFSRGFDNPQYSEQYQRWVSGGFSPEIALPHNQQMLPEKIKMAVNQGDFRINDNYPPANFEEVALLAREIDEYSVLAVATKAIDDRSRPLIAYRYFWLEKPTLDIDGVGTLLIWWFIQNQPHFQFDNEPGASQLNYNLQLYNKQASYEYFKQFYSQTSETLMQIERYPYAFFINQIGGRYSRRKLHFIALHLHRQYGVPLAWAWNVGWLERPTFTLIYCADEQAYQYMSNDIKPKIISKQVPNSTVQDQDEFLENQQKGNYSGQYSTSNLASYSGQSTTSLNANSSQQFSHQVKRCLLNIARNNDEKINYSYLSELINLIRKIHFEQWEWNTIIDQTTFYNPPSPATSRYRALLALLGYTPIYSWLEWLATSKNDNYNRISATLQEQLLNLSYNYNKQNDVYLQIQYKIYRSLSELLLNCLNKAIIVNSPVYPSLQWLLINSGSIWSRQFKEYSKSLLRQLTCRYENTANDQLYGEILKLLLQQTSGQITKSHKYQILAILLKEIENYSLSAFFYQLSQSHVPADVYSQVHVEIIPLTPSNHSTQKKTSFPFGKVIGISLCALITMIGVVMILYYFKSSTTNISERSTQILSNNLERDMYLWERTGYSQAKKNIIQQLQELTSSNKGSNFDEYDKSYAFIKNSFVVKPTLQSQNLDKIPLGISQQDQHTLDVEVIQKILKSIGDYQGNTSGYFDPATAESIKQFQKKNNLTVKKAGDVDKKTWEKLAESPEFVKEQVTLVADFLLKSFKTHKKDLEIKQDVSQLKNCKEEVKGTSYINYTNCIEKLIFPPN